ncbi:MAG: DNA polymerase III subunit delta [Elusimicrobiaceae bacterium]|nr:DNA polymerase III subunit delta [Elusimicrobiaceae bacterium]
MKAKLYQLDALIPRLQREFKGALVFGTDNSGVQEVAQKIKNIVIPNAGPFSLISLTPTDLKNAPNRVLEEANTPDLMGGRRLIWLKDATAAHADIMSDFVQKRQTDAFLLMTAENLTKSAALRVESETSPDILVIACYPPEVMDLRRIIMDFAREAGFDFAPDAIDYLIQNTDNNTLILKNELNKIELWNQDKKRIDLALTQQLVGMGTVNSDTLIQAVANHQTERVILALNALLLQGENPVTLLRMVAKYFSNLLKGVDKMAAGEASADVAKKILKPAQFRLEESVIAQLHSWTKESLLKAHKTLLNAEIQIKSGIVDPELVLKQTLLMLTKK